jgi:hypothetical protein
MATLSSKYLQIVSYIGFISALVVPSKNMPIHCLQLYWCASFMASVTVNFISCSELNLNMHMQLLSNIERNTRRDSRSQIQQEGTELEMKFLEQYLEIKICY